jgi:hypothetical protein
MIPCSMDFAVTGGTQQGGDSRSRELRVPPKPQKSF